MDEKQLENYEAMIRESELQNRQNQLAQYQQQLTEEDGRSMISEQLDLGEEKERIYYLLKGYVLKRDDKGNVAWVESEDPDMKVLTSYGVDYIMGAIQWYLNKNTLLSNYDEDTINRKMEDFSTTLVDYVFMHYEKMFEEPTLDECKEEIRKRIQKKVDIKQFAAEMIGKKIKKEEVENQILQEMEGRIERELGIIREQKMKGKLKRFESIIRFIQDAVHSTYMRAWKGQERSTLRTHMHISETKGGPNFSSPSQGGGLNPLSWLKRK